MNKIFNSTYEVTLRILLLLYEYKNTKLSLDMILNIDFICTYAMDFEISKININGDNDFKFAEIPSRRLIIEKSLKLLVLKGYIDMNYDENGFTYKIKDLGLTYSKSLTSNYANTFREILNESKSLVENKSCIELSKLIRKVSINSLIKETI